MATAQKMSASTTRKPSSTAVPILSTQPKHQQYTIKFWSMLILVPILIASLWWGWRSHQQMDIWKPGFVNLGLMKRDLQSGEIIQLQLVIRTESPKEAQQLSPHLQQLRKILLTTTGKETKETLIHPKGRQSLKQTLTTQFEKELKPELSHLIKELLYTEFLII